MLDCELNRSILKICLSYSLKYFSDKSHRSIQQVIITSAKLTKSRMWLFAFSCDLSQLIISSSCETRTFYAGYMLKKRALIIVGTFHMSPWPFLTNWYRSRRLMGYLISNKSTKIHTYTLQLGTLFRSSSDREKSRRHIHRMSRKPSSIHLNRFYIGRRIWRTRLSGNFRLFSVSSRARIDTRR